MMPQGDSRDLREFVSLLSELKGITELKVVRAGDESWIGLRVGNLRPPHVLLQQVSKAAAGFGLDPNTVHFGLLAD